MPDVKAASPLVDWNTVDPPIEQLPAGDAIAAHPEPPPIDVAAEREAYKALIDFINDNKEPDTTIEHVSLDEYLAGLE